MTQEQVEVLATFIGREIERRVRRHGWGVETVEAVKAARAVEEGLQPALVPAYKRAMAQSLDAGLRDLLNLPIDQDDSGWNEGLGDA